MQIKIHHQKPPHFKGSLEVSACYIEIDGKLLLMKRSPHKIAGEKWGVPAGKLEAGETPLECAKRELFEETGIDLPLSQFKQFGTLYICREDTDYTYHMMQVNLTQFPLLNLSDEHTEFKWVPSADLETMDLIPGAGTALKFYYENRNKPARKGAVVNVGLLLRNNEKVLLSLRQNTGFGDGYYGLVSGHVEEGESATNAMIREAYEEAGIVLTPTDIEVVHVVHHLTNRPNIHIYFECKNYQGEVVNKEPEKCGGLEYFPLSDLPPRLMKHIAHTLQLIKQGQTYSERGWDTKVEDL